MSLSILMKGGRSLSMHELDADVRRVGVPEAFRGCHFQAHGDYQERLIYVTHNGFTVFMTDECVFVAAGSVLVVWSKRKSQYFYFSKDSKGYFRYSHAPITTRDGLESVIEAVLASTSGEDRTLELVQQSVQPHLMTVSSRQDKLQQLYQTTDSSIKLMFAMVCVLIAIMMYFIFEEKKKTQAALEHLGNAIVASDNAHRVSSLQFERQLVTLAERLAAAELDFKSYIEQAHGHKYIESGQKALPPAPEVSTTEPEKKEETKWTAFNSMLWFVGALFLVARFGLFLYDVATGYRNSIRN